MSYGIIGEGIKNIFFLRERKSSQVQRGEEREEKREERVSESHMPMSATKIIICQLLWQYGLRAILS